MYYTIKLRSSLDAAIIARFCKAIEPQAWKPLAPEVKELQALLRRLESVMMITEQERNRLETATPTVAEVTIAHLQSLEQLIEQVKQLINDHFDKHPQLKQQRQLLTSIPGIGEQTAAVILAELGCVENYKSARQLAADAGLTPQEYSSGSSVKGKPRLSHVGNPRRRKALYMPAVVAMTHNRLLKSFTERLLARGKVKMPAVGAVMRKLLHLAYGILKSQQPFDPNYLSANSIACR